MLETATPTRELRGQELEGQEGPLEFLSLPVNETVARTIDCDLVHPTKPGWLNSSPGPDLAPEPLQTIQDQEFDIFYWL